ncbi:hypothetical protein [Aeromonas dhakensis]|uniref:hypothetical protein n=1 Tax=Aeromonas dhakensis TaxID=196024 RepID=UPI00197CFAD1|nr:hypothetical protein [Aeromonas dhakensis]MBW3731333.1 hypothetical protein [Aeromonas dhakensis]QSR55960.1 hypothetical protein GO601_11320 [Aeromonas dhakensis]
MLQSRFEAGVGDGFNITPDSGLTALTDFVDQVVSTLQKRGLLCKEYEETTLCGHLGFTRPRSPNPESNTGVLP